MIPFIPSIVPNVLQALVLVLAFSLVLAPVLRKYPVPFYVAFFLMSLLTLTETFTTAVLNPDFEEILDLFVSCYTGVAFYLVVMFAGALPRRWWVTKRLLSVRTELSIIGGFIVGAHVIRVFDLIPLSFSMYWNFIWANAAPIMFAAVSLVGIPLLVCFLIPWITSFRFIRKRMKHKTWKRIQRLAYPFMALLVLQGILLSVAHAVYLGPESPDYIDYMVNAATYVAFGIAYLVLKLRMVMQRRAKKQVNAEV